MVRGSLLTGVRGVNNKRLPTIERWPENSMTRPWDAWKRSR